MSTTYRVLCRSLAVSPITHMSRTEGNEAIVAREPVATPLGLAWVPCLSGNAIRHRIVREPGMRWLVDEYGMAGKLSLPQLNFLFHGGALTEGGGREDTRRIADWQRLWPLGRLLGGSLPDQILAGSLLVGRGSLAWRENRAVIAYLAPGAAPASATLRSAESFVSGYQYTRGDARKSGMAFSFSQSGDESPSSLMIFAGQAVTQGSTFLHDFTLKHVFEAELSSALALVAAALDGRGRLDRRPVGPGSRPARPGDRVAPDFGPDAAVSSYLGYARSVKEDAAKWLMDAFARPEKIAPAAKPEGGKPKGRSGA